jgi:hypothetical protein
MNAQENGLERANNNGSLGETSGPGVAGDRDLLRFLVGLLLLGSDELAQGLGGAKQPTPDALSEEETSSDVLRHLTLGLLARGERQAGRSLRTVYYASVGTASWTFHTLDRWTDNRFMRPLRRPIERRIRNWREEAAQIIEEGKREEQNSRAFAAESVESIVKNIFEQVAESEEVDRLIKELIGQKSMSFTASVVDNVRTLTATADYALEGALRRLLRRTPRRALPPSPLEGQPQAMYASRNMVKEVDDGR